MTRLGQTLGQDTEKLVILQFLSPHCNVQCHRNCHQQDEKDTTCDVVKHKQKRERKWKSLPLKTIKTDESESGTTSTKKSNLQRVSCKN